MSSISISRLFKMSFWKMYTEGSKISTLIVTFTQWNGLLYAYREKNHFDFETLVKCYARIGFVFLLWPVYLFSYTQDYLNRKELNKKIEYSRGDKLFIYDSYFQTAIVLAEGKTPQH